MSTDYGASSIQILPPLEAVRRRPAMYIGSSGPQGLYQLLVEVVQNAVDEAIAGACSEIRVQLLEDSIVVEDNGRGIPVEALQDGRSALEAVLIELHAGGKFRSGAYHAAGGLHGVGLSCVNALSARLQVEVKRDGVCWQVVCEKGRIVQGLTRVGDTLTSGTSVRFWPDPTIFQEGTRLEPETVAAYLEEQAFLQPGLRLELGSQVFQSDQGLEGLASKMVDAGLVHPKPVHIVGEYQGIEVEAALQWTIGYGEHVRSFVNRVRTPQGGTHVEGFSAAILRACEAIQAGMLGADEELSGADVRDGLCAVLAVRFQDPEFEGQTKVFLTSPLAQAAVAQVIEKVLKEAFAADPSLGKSIVGKAIEATRARLAARRAGERARYRSFEQVVSKDAYRQQFGIRSKNWHESARWLTDSGLLGTHAAMTEVAPDASVLDICCGSGVVGASFRGKVGKITGLDLTPQMVKLASERLDEVVQGDVYAIPFPEASFELVVNREVLHLLPEPERPVAQVLRVLKPGGQFIVGQLVPYGAEDAAWFFRVVKKKQPLFFNNLMEADMIRLLQDAGFKNIRTAEYFQWEDIDLWIDTWETPNQQRHEIRDLYHHAPQEARAIHPFKISPEGRILDQWRWVVFSARKPG